MSSVNVSIVVTSPASTSVTYTPAQPSFSSPVAVGTIMGTFAIAPVGWAGTFSLSGADAASFAVNTSFQLTAAVQLAAKTYALTATATP